MKTAKKLLFALFFLSVLVFAIPTYAQEDWNSLASSRRRDIDAYLKTHLDAFEAFDFGSLGDATLEMIPYVVFRVLQELEPEVFSDSALASVGFYERTDAPSRLNGINWTTPIQAKGDYRLRYMSRSCASCHAGRVRLEDGSTHLLVGSANTEMNLHLFIGRLTSLFQERLGPNNESEAYLAFRTKIAEALDKHPPEWYWGKTELVSSEDAAREIGVTKSNLDNVLSLMRQMNVRRLAGLDVLSRHSYNAVSNAPDLKVGAPGLVETSGLGSTSLVSLVGEDKASLVLPPGPSMADIPAVWMIDANGFANWDGTVVGFSRSLTSSLAVVGDPTKINLKTNSVIQNFISKLPATPYPFPIDDESRLRGASVFEKNCAGCHSPSSNHVREVFDVGSDARRSNAVQPTTVKMMEKVLRLACPPTQTEFVLSDPPLIDPSSNRGYVASALHGIWAQAPYLHNGSVPTLRHLLTPALRNNERFIRGSISYDQADGGWEWDPKKLPELQAKGDNAVVLHDINKAGFSNSGHGSQANPFVLDRKGNRVRIAWTDSEADRKVVNDLIAYLLSL